LKSFLDKTKLPFVTTQMGKGVENESSEQYLGTAALTDNDYVHCALNYADVIIAVGHDTTEKPPVIMTRDTHKVIHINFYEASIDDVYVPTLEVVGDIGHTLWALNEQIKVSDWDLAYFKKVRIQMQKQIQEKSDSNTFPVKPQRIIADMRAVMPSDGILSLDNGMYKIWISRNYPAYEQNTVLLDNALATMGAGLPAGIAAKMLNPEKKVLVVAGDGGVMMNISELETAKRLNLDLVVLILNDSGFGMIKWKQGDMNLPNFGLEFTNPDFIKLAESFGAIGHRITDAQEFKPTLEKALNSKGIHIIDCPVDYSENKIIFGEELTAKTCEL
jgi:acetolactate synthase-1/2/3 large subunit